MKALYFLAGAALIFATPATAQQLVTNGGFETGDFAGFTQFGNSFDNFVTPGIGTGGSFGAEFGPVETIGGISQTLLTVAGQTYTISFDLANDGGTPSFFGVNFGNSLLFSAVDSPAFAFTSFSTTAVATESNTVLSFSFRQDPNFFQLDNVSVTGVTAAVPEPGTWAMMLMGFGAMGVAMRRRRAVATITQAA